MSKLICELSGCRGRSIKVYENKVVINTAVTLGSVITNNATDGEKTIFLKDVVGVQFKRSGFLIGYLQFETPSMQMNNQKDNMFSENAFTFDCSAFSNMNEVVEELYGYICDRVEELKYGTDPTPSALPGILKIKPMLPSEAAALAQKEAQTSSALPAPSSIPAFQETWACSNCGTTNKVSYGQCKRCGSYRKK